MHFLNQPSLTVFTIQQPLRCLLHVQSLVAAVGSAYEVVPAIYSCTVSSQL